MPSLTRAWNAADSLICIISFDKCGHWMFTDDGSEVAVVF